MSSIINRLFQKSPAAPPTIPRNDYQKILDHFSTQGFNSVKRDLLLEKIENIGFSPTKEIALLQLTEAYLEIERYLIIQDAEYVGSKDSLRTELKENFPEVASSPVFTILYLEDTVQEIALALLLAKYLYEHTLDHCGYVPIIAPEFNLEKNIALDKVKGNLVYYLSCKRKVREYIENLFFEARRACGKKGINIDFEDWFSQFTSHFALLDNSQKILDYLPEKAAIATSSSSKTSFENTTGSVTIEHKAPQIEKSPIQNEVLKEQDDVFLYGAMFENLLDKAIIFEHSGTIIRANEAARKLFKFNKDSLSKNNIFNVLPREISQELKKDIEDTTHKRKRIVLGERKEIYLSKPDDSVEYYELTTSNNYTEGEDTYSIFLKNITSKRATIDTLSKEMEHVQRAAKFKATFLSNMSHEIRTPLNVILGLADIIKKSDNGDQELFKKNIEGIDFSAKNLLSIVNDILDFSKIEAGKLSIQSYDFNIRKVITSLTDGFKTKANEKGVNLTTVIHKEIPDIVVGDQYRLNQILTNLIGNAIKFTSEGEIKVITSHKERSKDQIEVHFEVRDSGIGIPSDKLDNIFESFYQIDEPGHTKSNGTGLGLAITKELISLQGGILTATSIEGKGSSFYFSIPLTKSKLQSTEETIKTESRSDKQLEGLRVLVAEDNTMNQFYIKQLLSRLLIEVDIAENGQEAIDIYESKENGYYNLILMDMHMPVLGGIEAIEKIRNSHKDSIKKVPIVICSADVFPESRKRAIKAGIDFYLTKPVDESALKEVLFWLIADDDQELGISLPLTDDNRSDTVNVSKLRETFDNDEDFIISLLEVFIKDTPVDFKSLSACVEREFYSRASLLAHKMKSNFMSLGMTHQGYLLQQIENNIHSATDNEMGLKYFEQFKKIYSKTQLDVNILLIELKRL